VKTGRPRGEEAPAVAAAAKGGLHARAKRETLNHFGVHFNERIISAFKGRPDSAFFEHVSSVLAGGKYTAGELSDFEWRRYVQIAPQVELVPGAVEFISAAKRKFKPVGLVTSARGRDVEIANRVLGFLNWFDFVIHGDHTTYHKPHPEPYLRAIETTGLQGRDILVIEDSPNGIRSARAAGCRVAGITTSFEAGLLADVGAQAVCSDFCTIGQRLKLENTPA